MAQKKTPKVGERRLSWMILFLLAGIGVVVFRVQQRLNPAVEIITMPVAGIESSGPRKKGEQLSVMIPVPEGMVAGTPLEIFLAENLADKIDGKADLYLSSGFARLFCRRFVSPDDSDFWIEILVYDMNGTRNAFAVFSLQRRSGAVRLDVTPFAYQAENALFFAHGHYYVEMISSRLSEIAQKKMRSAAEQFVRNAPVPDGEMPEPRLFPETNRVENSIKLIASDAFGFEGFNGIFTTDYRDGEKNLSAFLSVRPTSQEAESLAEEYARFLLAFGGEAIPSTLNIKNAKVRFILDTYEIVFVHNRVLAGVREAEDLQQAISLAELIQKELIRHDQ